MDHFRRLKEGCNPAPFLAELDAFQAGFQAQTGPEEREPVPRENWVVPLRGVVRSAKGGRARRDVHESRWTSGSHKLPGFQEFLKQVAADEDGILGRARIVGRPAGGSFLPVEAPGAYLSVRNRYHLVLKSRLGSAFTAGDEAVLMQESELWWLDSQAALETTPEGDDDRIHLIFELLPRHLEAHVLRESRRAQKKSRPV